MWTEGAMGMRHDGSGSAASLQPVGSLDWERQPALNALNLTEDQPASQRTLDDSTHAS